MREMKNGISSGCSLCVRGFSVWRHGRETVHDVSFRLRPGLVGLLGPNGSGKTTLMKGMLDLGLKRQGEIWLESAGPGGEPMKTVRLERMAPRQLSACLAYVPQDTVSGGGFSVLEFAAMGRTRFLSFLENPGRDDYEAAGRALEEMGIRELADRSMDALSGGERKLAWLARARVQEAQWTILDEPAGGLDFGRQHDFFASLKRTAGQRAMGILASIHDPQLAFTYCDQVLFMKEGRIPAQVSRTDGDFEERFIRLAGGLYHMTGQTAEAMGEKPIIWRREADA